MHFLRILLSRCAALFHRTKLDTDLDEELRSHIDLAIEENLGRGKPEQEARTAALRDFGGMSQVAERYRVQRGLPLVDVLIQDLCFAVRQLRNSPGFTLTALITLALGIGANTTIFTFVHGILLRSLPVTDPPRLYRIGDTDDCCVQDGFAGENGDFDIFSYDLYQYLKTAAPEFEQLAAVTAGQSAWSVRRGNALTKSLNGEFVSGNYFSMLGLGAYAGRVFSENDDTASASPAIVLSYQTWQGEFASDPSIVGSTVFIQARPFTVIGIAPPGFFGDRVSDIPPDLWMPLQTEPYVRGGSSILHHADSHWLYPLGRLRSGSNVEVLQAKLSLALREWLSLRSAYTENGGSAIIPRQHVTIMSAGRGIQTLQQQTGAALRMLMILSSIVLLIACANIGNLLLARATARRAEISVRLALGAGRRRVILQILTESLLLSCIGGLAGLGVAYAGSHLLLVLAFPDARNMPVSASPSLPVLGFAFMVSLFTGILFGTAPAWLSSHAQPAEVLRGVNRSMRDRSSLPQKALVAFQAALSLVLIAGAILMTESLTNLERQSFGIATANRYVVHFDPLGAGYSIFRLPQLYRQIEDRFSTLPAVTSVGLAFYSPLEGANWGECIVPQGHPAPGPNDHCGSTWDRVSTHFLDAIGVPIVRGRGFNETDTGASPQVAVVNETFVKKFFPKQDPVGKHFGVGYPHPEGNFEIVGVFRDFKMNNPREPIRAVYLRPISQQFFGFRAPEMIPTETRSMFINSMVLAFNRPQQNADALIRSTLDGIDPNLTVTDVRTFEAQVAGNFNGERVGAQLTGVFGILALVLASVGLFGVMSYFVARRTGEIGIRMALGATRSRVVTMVLRSALWPILIGLAFGIPAALLAGHLMSSLLYGVASYDLRALASATVVLCLCAIAAGLIPAHRAASIEPMQALRTE
jgi:macrolide transport system ATP-binding/permease protein